MIFECYSAIRSCFALLFIATSAGSIPRKCQKKVYDENGNYNTVCVCNATYCDDLPNVGKLSPFEAAIFKTSQSGKRFERSTGIFEEPTNETSLCRIIVDAQMRYQTIIGFGGAFTDAAGINMNTLSEEAHNAVLDAYFGPKGLQYTLGRVPIASCDFSTHEYSYDNYNGDFQLKNFSLTEEDTKLKIPNIKKALKLAHGALKLIALPWSAPAWMKTNGAMVGGGTLRGQPDGPYYTTWAKYYVKFLESYMERNVTFWGLTVQNEPTTGADLTYKWQTMYFSPKTERDFIKKHLGPMLRKSDVGKNITLMIMDDQRTQLPIWADVVLNDKDARKYVSGIAVHWYADFAPASQLSETHNRHPDVFILATEACTGYSGIVRGPILGDWNRADEYAHDIIEDLSNWVTGWLDWNLCLDLKGGPNFVKNFVDSPIIVNASADEFYKQPMYYIMGHFSKFLRPGDVRIGLHFYKRPMMYEGVAFTTGKHQRVLILHNRQTKSIVFSVKDTVIPNKVLRVKLGPRTIATVVWNK